MKITAGLSRVRDYPAFVQAGADEVFCGYVPNAWYERYGMHFPLNRREVKYPRVQIGCRNDLKILHSMTEDMGAPAVLAFNALSYLPEQYPMIADILDQCISDGYSDFILADPALLCYLQEMNIHFSIHLSGEAFTMNPEALALFDVPNLKRVIFHRHLSVPDMEICIRSSVHPHLEYEAFILNERCHYHGALCASLHCDALSPMCQVPYILDGSDRELSHMETDPAAFGSTGCGLCAIPDLKACGITHLKIVGRGNYTEYMIRDIRSVRQALTAAEDCSGKEQYVRAVRKLFPDGCPNNCYYRTK